MGGRPRVRAGPADRRRRYDYRQISDDSGAGARIGPFRGRVNAVGPGLTYTTLLGQTPFILNVRIREGIVAPSLRIAIFAARGVRYRNRRTGWGGELRGRFVAEKDRVSDPTSSSRTRTPSSTPSSPTSTHRPSPSTPACSTSSTRALSTRRTYAACWPPTPTWSCSGRLSVISP